MHSYLDVRIIHSPRPQLSQPTVNSNDLSGHPVVSRVKEPHDGGCDVIRLAQNFLQEHYIVPDMNVPTWQLNRQAFILYAMARSGEPDVARIGSGNGRSRRL